MKSAMLRKVGFLFGALFLGMILFLNTNAYAASLGDQLREPEEGWKRYDDTYPAILRENGKFQYSPPGQTNDAYQSGYFYTTDDGATISFDFTGPKVRIIAPIYTLQSNDIEVRIDGEKITNYSQYGLPMRHQVILFEKLDLGEGRHSVTLTNNQAGKQLEVDAIDIDANGELLTPERPTTPTDPTEPEDPTTPEQPSGNRALLVITMTTGLEKEYDLSTEEVNDFIAWYEGKQAGAGKASYAIDKHDNNKGPFSSRKDYILFDRVLTFEVSEYN